MPDDARREILARIGGATEGVRDPDPDGTHARLHRDYGRESSDAPGPRLDRFETRLVDYDVDVVRTTRAKLAEAVARELARKRVRRLVVPAGLPEAWLARAGRLERVHEEATPRALDQAGATLTGCAVAIAETGTIVLDGGPGQGRRAATLVPDLHLCVVHASQVVSTVPEAVARLGEQVAAGRPLTWISGPSATSDIELVRVAGVHGPRTLVTLLVSDA